MKSKAKMKEKRKCLCIVVIVSIQKFECVNDDDICCMRQKLAMDFVLYHYLERPNIRNKYSNKILLFASCFLKLMY